ncbi:tRNA adenosine(34) deaminase TadA [Pseudidiomarina gelatinasegens]|jgi:tRNA(adenine34) deaminase|uniref:tRNA-specific adenosine deaminase n=1 Tax=Pseudidiomarina gelatinasegens TaxID=2487740 RepID=A0A443YXZ3_9GAMM|nr:tRNA adenosine(34) deaminase TadA [Pseudidiomarina gelatinasegens]RWU08918.1 tRNA adenosine(34) deaminase TadA [Pseudidiomarina gelatinasegens]|tara:strand:- start:1528 stop:1974 length:447 start_codon:yes stop_codon:yes gene_type:complete
MHHEDFMRRALELAQTAEEYGEVPVGAVLVLNNEIIGEGFNQVITLNDPSAHAEALAIRAAGQALGNYRLVDTTLYVTLEPCAMCAGLITHARIKTLVYGATDPRTGAAGTAIEVLNHSSMNHKVEIIGGVLAEECGDILRNFFRKRR